MRKRVLFVCPLGEFGGAEQVAISIANAMEEQGFSAVFATMRPGPLATSVREQGISAYEFPESHRYRDLRLVKSAIQWLAALTQKLDISLLHSIHTAHLYAGIVARRLHKPEIWHLFDYPDKRINPVELVLRRIPTTHAIITTKHVASAYPKLCRGAFSIIPPTCISASTLKDQPAVSAIRAEFGLPAGELLLTVARLQEHKGHPYLIEAAAIVLRERPDALFVIVGKASKPDQQRYLDNCLAQAAALKISNRLRFVGFVDNRQLAALYREATALIHPAWSEGYGLVLLEAMGMGVPVVAVASYGPIEIVENEISGLLAAPRDPNALAAAILRLLGDKDLQDRLRAGGEARASRLNLQTMLSSTVEVYRRYI